MPAEPAQAEPFAGLRDSPEPVPKSRIVATLKPKPKPKEATLKTRKGFLASFRGFGGSLLGLGLEHSDDFGLGYRLR